MIEIVGTPKGRFRAINETPKSTLLALDCGAKIVDPPTCLEDHKRCYVLVAFPPTVLENGDLVDERVFELETDEEVERMRNDERDKTWLVVEGTRLF